MGTRTGMGATTARTTAHTRATWSSRRTPIEREAAMWVRQCDLDAGSELPLPIPSRIASNEEFIPPPQTPQQREYEARLKDISEPAAKAQGLSRRDFLRTGSGMAAALVALNQVFGNCYDV